jgi:hypothetical protein
VAWKLVRLLNLTASSPGHYQPPAAAQDPGLMRRAATCLPPNNHVHLDITRLPLRCSYAEPLTRLRSAGDLYLTLHSHFCLVALLALLLLLTHLYGEEMATRVAFPTFLLTILTIFEPRRPRTDAAALVCQ